MYGLYKEFKDEKLSLVYLGVFSNDITPTLIELSDVYISKIERLSKLRRKATYLIAESFQNIMKHGILEKQNISEIRHTKDFFQITILDDRIVISSANVLENQFISEIDVNIDYINSLDSDDLKALYHQKLNDGILSDKGGAGLGLIEMVRKSGLPLNKRFLPMSDGFSLLILSIEIPISEDLKEHKVDIDLIGARYKKLAEADILMLYKGDFSSSSNNNIINMLSSNFATEGEIRSDQVKNIVAVIEVMQNVSKHGRKINEYKDGIFALSITNGELYIRCGNFINRDESDSLRATLKSIKSCSIEEIETMYRNRLSNSYLTDEDNSGLGLLEIARFTGNSFEYSFEEIPGGEIFYTINLKTI